MQINTTNNINFGWVRTPFMCFTNYRIDKKALREVAKELNCNITVRKGIQERESIPWDYVGEIYDEPRPGNLGWFPSDKGVYVTISEKPDDIWQMLFGDKKEITNFISAGELGDKLAYAEYRSCFKEFNCDKLFGIKKHPKTLYGKFIEGLRQFPEYFREIKDKYTPINITDQVKEKIGGGGIGEGMAWKLAIAVGCGIFGYSYRKTIANFLGKERLLRNLGIIKCEKLPKEYAKYKFRF